MSTPLRCTVVVPTYNRRTLLGHTLESLARQRMPREEFEVIVVDDGSSDGTAELVADYTDRLQLKYFFQEDRGNRSSLARNVGATNARSDVCVFVDDGVILHSGCVQAHVASHEAADGPVAVCGYVYGFNLDNEDAEVMEQELDFTDADGVIDRLEREHRWLDVREKFYKRYDDDFADLPAPWVIYWSCNVSAPTALVREVGGFDETLTNWGGEDLDLGYRLHRAGARFIVNRRASAFHVPHEKNYLDNEAEVAVNYRAIAAKYDTPITRLLPEFPAISPFTMNDVIVERNLPSCAEYLSAQRA